MLRVNEECIVRGQKEFKGNTEAEVCLLDTCHSSDVSLFPSIHRKRSDQNTENTERQVNYHIQGR